MNMTRETLDAFIKEVLRLTSDEKAQTNSQDAQEAYADEMRRLGWRG